MNNVVRHSGARRCTVRLSLDGGGRGGDGGRAIAASAGGRALVVEVRDDGRGIPDDVAAGVGMLSLRERAAELGGSVSVECPPSGGTVVRAVLPCNVTTGAAAPQTTGAAADAG